MYPGPGKWVATRCAVVSYARAVHAFSAVTKCQHCNSDYGVWPLFTFVSSCLPSSSSFPFDSLCVMLLFFNNYLFPNFV